MDMSYESGSAENLRAGDKLLGIEIVNENIILQRTLSQQQFKIKGKKNESIV